MTRILLATAALALLAGCAELNTGIDIVRDKACADPLPVRHARATLFAHLSGQQVSLDCDNDGAPDALGTWVAPRS